MIACGKREVVAQDKFSENNSYKVGKPVHGVKAVVTSKSGSREETGTVVYERKVEYREQA